MGERGYFIVLEGCDRAGKTTQIKLLKEHFIKKNIACINISFPHYDTDIGQLIKQKLHNGNTNPHELHLLFTANRYELQSHIKHYIESGITILCDRYKASGIAYGAEHQTDFSWFQHCDDINYDPDIVVYLDIHPDINSKRHDFGNGGIYEKYTVQQRVRENYLKLITDNWILINANQPIQTIHTDIIKSLSNFNINI